MAQLIMVGCDLHDKTMLLKTAEDSAPPQTRTLPNTAAGRERLIAELQAQAAAAGGARIVFAYEASGLGFGLHDQLSAAGIHCYVLAPTGLARSATHKRRKTDERDAQQLLEVLRGHFLAGNKLPAVWIPDPQTRDDRELVRMRLDLAEKITALKTQIKSLLKRQGRVPPETLGSGWTRKFQAWLHGLTHDKTLGSGAQGALESLLKQLKFFEEELARFERERLLPLTSAPRYAAALAELQQFYGVGLVTALVFLTELGDLQRFPNRRQLSAYLGLVPTSNESGDCNDRKGHITRQGPSRVRKVLCQATWSRVRAEGPEHAAYQGLVEKNPKRKKVAVVAMMRRLAIRMWHKAREAQAAAATSPATCAAEMIRMRGAKRQPPRASTRRRRSNVRAPGG